VSLPILARRHPLATAMNPKLREKMEVLKIENAFLCPAWSLE
jgi:hypothetical protein